MRGIFTILFFLLTTVEGLGQHDNYFHYTNKHGLPSNEVYDILQDRKGYIWLGTDNGLCCFDGVHFKTFSCEGMSSKAGSYLKEDDLGNIWYCNFDGQLFYTDGLILHLFPAPSITTYSFQLQSQKIAFIHNNEMMSFDLKGHLLKKKYMNYPVAFMNRCGDMFSVSGINNNTVSLYNLDLIQKGQFNSREANIFSVLKDSTHYYLIEKLTDYILIKDGASGNCICKIPCKERINGSGFSKGQLWIATNKGCLLYHVKNKTYRILLEKEQCSSFMQDRQNILWVTTKRGLYSFMPENDHESYPLSESNYTLDLSSYQRLMYSDQGEVFEIQKSEAPVKLFQTNQQQKIYKVLTHSQIEFPSHWRPILQGENQYFRNHGKHYLILNSGVKDQVDISNTYSVFAASGALLLYQKHTSNKKDRWDTLYSLAMFVSNQEWPNTKTLIGNVRAKSLAYDSIHHILFCSTNLGVFRITSKGMDTLKFQTKKLFADKLVFCSSKLFGLQSNGILWSLQGDQINYEEIPDNIGYNVKIQAGDERLILWNDKTIYFSDRNIHDKSNQRIHWNSLPYYNQDEIIHSAACVNDSLFVTTGNRLFVLPIRERPMNQTNNPFYITYLTAGHHLFQVQKEQVPGITEEPLEIQFSYLDYLPFHTDIYYKLNDQEWEKVPNGSRSIRFDKLAYGDYTIRFKVNNKEREQISFSVLRPWYMRIPALLLYFVFITSLLFFLYKKRIHQQKKETALLLEKNRLEEDLRHSMLTSIKSQMNPHFLFNALNTIQSYIITEDKDHAASYLSKFSRLTRSILEMSEKKTVLLKEEIDALLLYIDLEKMRFPDLAFHFQIDTSLNTQNVIIPSMIIQPYIENAIKHGLLHKLGMKELHLHFFQKDNLLCIDIKDNGIGRTKSELINRQRKNHHRSFASEANRKRVELLQAEDTRIHIFYEDLYDSNAESLGTIVHIQLPLKFQHD